MVAVLVYSFVFVTLPTAAACYQRYRTAPPDRRRLLLALVLLLLIFGALVGMTMNQLTWNRLLLSMVGRGCVGLVEALTIRSYGQRAQSRR